MKITSAQLDLSASHKATQERQVTESLRTWIGARPETTPATITPDERQRQQDSVRVQLSELGQETLAADESAQASESVRSQVENDPRLQVLRAAVEMLTGRKMKIFDAEEIKDPGSTGVDPRTLPDPANPSGNGPANFGIEYDYHESYAETEETHFAAQGVVRTADGKEISFKLELAMSRSYYEESNVSLRVGNAVQVKDPLVLNFNGTAAQLTDTRFKFDLDADGQKDNINFVTPGSGFLAFDRNKDGKINDGRELFGAISGDGFAELAALDDDRNGWIDENDKAFDQLRVWSKDAQGQDQLQTLKEANVGALSLAQVATPFSLKDENNQLQGLVRSTGIFLQENGEAGTMQKIDLTV